MKSIWQSNQSISDFKKQKGEIKTDVLVVGGGIAGILCAYTLKNAGVDVTLVEANRICSGVTGYTTAKITSQHGLIYHRMLQKMGEENTRLYLEAQESALKEYRNLCKSIDCDFENRDAFVYSRNDEDCIDLELTALQKLGYTAEYSSAPLLPFSVAGSVRFLNQGQFHPLKFLNHISHGLRIFENTKVLELSPDGLRTNRGRIRAEKIVIATHFPILNKHGMYFLKQYQERSYVLALKNAQDVNGMYIDAAKGGFSFRNYGNLLLLGGNSHRTGKQSNGWCDLIEFSDKYYPLSQEMRRWATQDCMTLDGVPYIGRYSKSTPNLYVATGFGKWGMTNAMVASHVITDLICGKKNPYEELFSPSRSMLHPQLGMNIYESLCGVLTPRKPRCPHLGCALTWNPQERSWDCSCHGSRFTENGELLNNPATDDLNRKGG